MLKLSRLLCIITLLSIFMLLNGCATVGRSFHFQNIPQLKIGEFNIEDCQEVFGKPHKVAKVINANGQYDVKQYLHASANIGTATARVLVLEFLDGKLNAYNFLSSFDEDRTLFNSENMPQIIQGKSTKNDVLQIMGKPNGMAMCPSILDDYKNRCGSGKVVEIWIWSSQRKIVTMARHSNQGSKTAYISFDTNGVVLAIESAE
ncbi:MAG: hypothetical protein ABIJ59_01865 [Pseudomonadota bacterium]